MDSPRVRIDLMRALSDGMNRREVPGTSELCCTADLPRRRPERAIALIDPTRGRFNPEAIPTPPRLQASIPHDLGATGMFPGPVPIARRFLLVSHAPQKHFALYVIDRFGNRELLYHDPKGQQHVPQPLQPASVRPVLAGRGPASKDVETGQFYVADVYQGWNRRCRGHVKYLRVCQEVRADLERLARRQLSPGSPPLPGLLCVRPRMWCKARTAGPVTWPKQPWAWCPWRPTARPTSRRPAGKVLYFQALDENLNELQRMRSVVSSSPASSGAASVVMKNRAASIAASSALALGNGPRADSNAPSWGAVPFSYEKVVQPVWDAQCVRCHDG